MGGPGVGDRLGDVDAQVPSLAVGDLVELGGGQLAPGPFGGPMRRVEQREGAVGAGRMNSDAGWWRRSAVRKASTPAARTSSKRLSPEPPLTAIVRTGASGSPATLMPCAVAGSRSAARAASSRTVIGWSSSQTRPRPRRPSGSVGSGTNGRTTRRSSAPARASETPGSARVRVGVGDMQRDVVLDQRVHHAALEGGGRDRRRTAQIEGMVGDQQIGAQLHRLVHDLPDRVDGEEDPCDLLVGVAHDGADRVPGLGPLGGPQVLQRGDDFRQTGHGQRLPGCSRRLNRCRRRPPHPARSLRVPQANRSWAIPLCEVTVRRSDVSVDESYFRRRR